MSYGYAGSKCGSCRRLTRHCATRARREAISAVRRSRVMSRSSTAIGTTGFVPLPLASNVADSVRFRTSTAAISRLPVQVEAPFYSSRCVGNGDLIWKIRLMGEPTVCPQRSDVETLWPQTCPFFFLVIHVRTLVRAIQSLNLQSRSGGAVCDGEGNGPIHREDSFVRTFESRSASKSMCVTTSSWPIDQAVMPLVATSSVKGSVRNCSVHFPNAVRKFASKSG